MEAKVPKSQFKDKALEYFRQVEATGESIVVTDHGIPKLEIRLCQVQERDPLITLHGTLLRYDAPTEPVATDDRAAQR